MLCKKCENQLNNDDRFCNHCGEPCGETNELSSPSDAPKDNSEEPDQKGEPEPSTSKIFVEQLGTLTKTGAKGIKESVTKAHAKAGEISSSIEKSPGFSQLGENKKLFLFMCGALVLNLVLLLSKTIYFELMHYTVGTFSVIGFCSEMLDFINYYGRLAGGASDGPFYMAVKYLEIIGIIFIAAAAIKTVLPMLQGNGDNPVSFKLIRTAAVYSVALTFFFMFFCTIALSSQRGVEFHLTLTGWIYVAESVVLIISALKLSPIVLKK